MASVNKVILIGHLGKAPEVRYFNDGSSVANVSLATSESWKDKETGIRKEQTEWHSVVFMGRLAEIAGQYLKKGDLLYVEGSLRTRKWQDKNGSDRYTTEIRAREMKMLGGRKEDRADDSSAYRAASQISGRAAAQSTPQPPARDTPPDDFDDDIPF